MQKTKRIKRQSLPSFSEFIILGFFKYIGYIIIDINKLGI